MPDASVGRIILNATGGTALTGLACDVLLEAVIWAALPQIISF